MTANTLDEELAAIRRRKPKRRRRVSKLLRFQSQILYLWHDAGASLEEIRIWLSSRARIRVHRSTIWRAIQRWSTSTAVDQMRQEADRGEVR